MTRLTPVSARRALKLCGVAIGADFFTLSSATVLDLLSHADAHRYRAPKNGNGSRGRYWHAHLQRVAARGAPAPAPAPARATVAQVHRFGDKVAVYVGKGQTTYIEAKGARALARALNRVARSIATESFGDSHGLTFELFEA